jgi:hypothetical protein
LSIPPPSKEYQDLYRAGVEAARAKDFERAYKLFQAAVTLDEEQKKGWLALARLESDPQTKAEYYRHVLRLDPQDAVARAFIDGMQQARPAWYRSRRIVGLLGLVALLLGVVAALLAGQGGQVGDQVLPTPAQFPTATPTTEAVQADTLSVEITTTESGVTDEATAQTETIVAPQVTLFSSSSSTQIFLAAPTAIPTTTVPGIVPTAVPPQPTVIIVPPTVAGITVTPGSGVIVTLVTAAPTSASAATATEQPLFMDITPPGPTSTGLPVFITPTSEFPGDFNTEVPPPDEPVIEDPNSGGAPRP